jgi:hypothetical protein
METAMKTNAASELREKSHEDEMRLTHTAKNITQAVHSLSRFRSTISATDKHPELGDAIVDMEIALNILIDNTGGMV